MKYQIDEGETSRGSGGRVRRKPAAKRASGSCFMSLTGCAAFPLILIVAVWNEKNFICDNQAAIVAVRDAHNVGCNASKVPFEKFGYFSCPIRKTLLPTPFSFESFNGDLSTELEVPVSFAGISGMQLAQMYQCQEACEAGVCSYQMTWAAHQINSDEFSTKQDNKQARLAACPAFLEVTSGNPVFPTNLHMGKVTKSADMVQVGESDEDSFTINHRLLQYLEPTKAVNLTSATTSFFGPLPANSGVSPWSRPLTLTSQHLGVGGTGFDLESCVPPYQLGCIRVKYYHSNPEEITALAHISSSGEVNIGEVSEGWGCEPDVLGEVAAGNLSLTDMVDGVSEDAWGVSLWLLRLACVWACVVAFYLAVHPITQSSEVVMTYLAMCPCGWYVEYKLEGMVDSVVCTMSVMISSFAVLVSMAAVWYCVRPLVAFQMCTIAACCICGAVGSKKAFGDEEIRHQELRRRGQSPFDSDDDDDEDSDSETGSE